MARRENYCTPLAFLTTREAAWFITSVDSVTVRVCQTVTFIYEGHRVTFKVIGVENVQNAYSRNVTFDVKDRAIKFACTWGFRLWRIEWCDRYLCHVTGSDATRKSFVCLSDDNFRKH